MTNAALSALLTDSIVLALAFMALVGFGVAALARTLFVSAMAAAAGGVCVAAALLTRGGGNAGVAVATLFGAWAPILLLAPMVLTGRVAKSTPRARGVPAAICAISMLAAVAPAALDLSSASALRGASPMPAISAWLAFVVLAAVVGCVGLLGFGERGALGGDRAEQDS